MELACPYCKSPMISGRVSIHGRLIDFLAVGLSSQQLWFAPGSDPKKEEKVLASWDQDAAEGCQCPDCGSVVIKGERLRAGKSEQALHPQRLCPNCGSWVESGSKICPWCGESMEVNPKG
jgi:endogenous inhibitor of DNA gyrase (YacG/DUF329 family)